MSAEILPRLSSAEARAILEKRPLRLSRTARILANIAVLLRLNKDIYSLRFDVLRCNWSEDAVALWITPDTMGSAPVVHPNIEDSTSDARPPKFFTITS